MKTVSENQFSGKTYVYTIASRQRLHEARLRAEAHTEGQGRRRRGAVEGSPVVVVQGEFLCADCDSSRVPDFEANRDPASRAGSHELDKCRLARNHKMYRVIHLP